MCLARAQNRRNRDVTATEFQGLRILRGCVVQCEHRLATAGLGLNPGSASYCMTPLCASLFPSLKGDDQNGIHFVGCVRITEVS